MKGSPLWKEEGDPFGDSLLLGEEEALASSFRGRDDLEERSLLKGRRTGGDSWKPEMIAVHVRA